VKSDVRRVKKLEIVLTISLITIVATVLFPRGVVLFDKAQLSSIEYTTSAYRASVYAVHNKWLVEPSPFVNIGKEEKEYSVVVNASGWPVAILDTAKLESSYMSTPQLQCERLWQVLLANNSSNEKEGKQKIKVRSKRVDGKCEYVYLLLDETYSVIYEPLDGSINLKNIPIGKT